MHTHTHMHTHTPCMHTHMYTHTHYSHLIEPGIWNSRQLAGTTIQEALMQWYSNRTVPVYFRDTCNGPHCNDQCPETFSLGKLNSNNWHPVAKCVIVGIVLLVMILCVILKLGFDIWLRILNKKQNRYNEEKSQRGNESQVKHTYVCMY